MWHITFEFVRIVVAVILCAIAVKLVDDFLDSDLDVQNQRYNFTQKLGRGAIVYGMLALAIAISIDAIISLPLFLASYSIGMFHEWRQTFPSRLTGWQEALLVCILGVILSSVQSMLFSIFFILSIQLLDDYLDCAEDEAIGYRNMAHRLGQVECLLLSLLTMLLAWQLNEIVFPAVWLGAVLFYSTLFFSQRRKC